MSELRYATLKSARVWSLSPSISVQIVTNCRFARFHGTHVRKSVVQVLIHIIPPFSYYCFLCGGISHIGHVPSFLIMEMAYSTQAKPERFYEIVSVGLDSRLTLLFGSFIPSSQLGHKSLS